MTTATCEYLVAPLEAVPVGEGRAFLIAGTTIAVFRTRSGHVYATQAACPHRGGPLADGLLGGQSVVCPLHARTYSLTDGTEQRTDCSITVYPARVTPEGAIAVSVPS